MQEDSRPRWQSGLAVFGGVIGASAVLLGPFLSPGLRRWAAPYIPANDTLLDKLVLALRQLPGGGAGRVLCDLGSGDGVVVLRAAEQVPLAAAWGVERNVWLVLYARLAALRRGRSAASVKVSFVRGDMWKQDYSGVDRLVVIGVPEMMAPLEQIIAPQLPDSAYILSGRFPLHSWRSDPDLLPPSVREGEGGAVDGLWVYSVAQNRRLQQ